MRTNSKRNSLMLLSGLGLGAALMYLFDPADGRRRRALVRERALRALSHTGDAAGARARDLRNRGAGLSATVGSRLTEEQPLDEVLVAMVRSAMGRSVSHPRSVVVTAEEGHVVLSGPIIAREVEGLLSRARRVRGVKSVRSRLEAHDRAADVPGLQGVPERQVGRVDLLERGWPLGAGLVGGAAIGALARGSAHGKSRLGAALGLAGAALLVQRTNPPDAK